ncbi:hypothetical protein Droror1_Dr00018525 [Drosera rotundifolia]
MQHTKQFSNYYPKPSRYAHSNKTRILYSLPNPTNNSSLPSSLLKAVYISSSSSTYPYPSKEAKYMHMGILPCAPPPSHSREELDDRSCFDHLRSESSSSSLFSHASLPSLGSLSLSDQPSTTYYHCVTTLKGHSSYVFSLVLDGENLYSGSYDDEVRLWSETGIGYGNEVVDNVVATGDGAVKSLVVLGDKLFVAHQDCRIRVWKIDGESEMHSHQKKYQCVATLPTLNDRFVKLFSAKNYVQVRRHKRCTWVHHVDSVSALAPSKDGTLLYSASWDRTFKVWRTSDFRCLESVTKAHDDAINALVVSAHGYVYTGSADKNIKVWRKHEGQKKHSLVATLEKHKSAVNALALSSDGQVLYSGACDRSILVWERDPKSENGHMRLVGALRGHTKAILCLTVVSDLLLSGSADNTVRIWKKGANKSYACIAVLEGHTRPIKCLTAAIESNSDEDGFVSGTSCLVYSGSLDHDIRVWKVWVPYF